MLHSSLSAASELRYQADGLECVLRRATQLLRAASVAAQAQVKTEGASDVLLADLLADTVVGMRLTVDEARSLLRVLGATRESIFEGVLWRLAVDEAAGVVHRHRH